MSCNCNRPDCMPCQATFKNYCQWPKCDCDRYAVCVLPNYVTNPNHGGKVTCHKCNGFIEAQEYVPYWDHQHRDEFPKIGFHERCFNRYEHYYGLDKPLD